MTELADPDDAVDRFIEIMVEERVDPANISILIDKIISRMPIKR